MSSFYAELHVEGVAYRVVHCAFACHQDVAARGRVQAKVHFDPLQLVLDVPAGDGLLAWAATPHKPLGGEVVFYNLAQQVASETIAFEAGECVTYAEQFASSATGDGAYVCHLTIAATKFELRTGGPAGVGATVAAFVPEVTASVPSVGVALMQEAADAAPANLSPLPARSTPQLQLSPGLATMLKDTFMVASWAGPGGPENFTALVHADLQAIYDTPTGRQLLESLQASGKRIPIHYAEKNSIEFNRTLWMRMFYDEDGVTPGAGLGVPVNYNPNLEVAGKGLTSWNTRPPAIGLAHELIHAEQAAYGRMMRYDFDNPGGPDSRNPDKWLIAPAYELDAVGLHPEQTYAFTENKIRSEWNPPQIKRGYY